MNKKMTVEIELWRAIGLIVLAFIGIYQVMSFLYGLLGII